MRLNNTTQSRRLGVASAVVGIFALLFGVLMSPIANAAPNTGIVVTVSDFVRSDANGNEQQGRLTVGDVGKLKFSWDGTHTTLTDGDTFSIGFGEYFRARDVGGAPIELKVAPQGQSEVTIGTCVVTTGALTCTFNGEVDRLKQQNFTDFKGNGSVLLSATKATTALTVDMDLNGTTTPITLPGGGGIKERPVGSWNQATFSKVATPLGAASTGVAWSISFNIATINQARQAAGLAPIPTDGTISTVTINDVIGAGQQIPDLLTLNVSVKPNTTQQLADRTNGPSTIANHEITVNTADDKRSAAINVTAPFNADTNYTIGMYAPIVDAEGNRQTSPLPGFLYKNTATVDGTSLSASFSRYYTKAFDVTIEMKDGFGGLRISKYIDGDGGLFVPTGTVFPVTVTYTFPNGRTASSYTGWTAPGTLNNAGTGGTFTYNVKVGEPAAWNGTLPQGTVITVAEDLGAVTNADGTPFTSTQVQWGTPVFAIGNTTTSTATIGNKTTTAFNLTNNAQARATFTVAKTVSGEDGRGATKAYTFTYTCTPPASATPNNPITGTVTATGNGQAVPAGASFPVGTECVIAEVSDSAAIDGYTLTAPGAQTVTLASAQTPAAATFTNTYTKNVGSLKISKAVVADAQFTGPTHYEINYECSIGNTVVKEDTVEVPANGSLTVDGLDAGATCVIEEAPIGAVPGYDLTTAYSANPVTIGTNTVTDVVVTNTFTPRTGDLTITKNIAGDAKAALVGKEVTFTYSCRPVAGDPQEDQFTVTLEDGTATHTVTGLREGLCTITEADPAQSNMDVATTYSVNGGAENDGAEATVQVGPSPAGVPTVAFTNTYTYHRGTLSIAKTVDLDDDSAAAEGKTFDFTYTCNGPLPVEPGTIRAVPGDGTVIPVDGLSVPVGSTCTITEVADRAQIANYTLQTVAPITVSVTAKDQVAHAAFTNVYVKNPTPATPVEVKPAATSKLAKTGTAAHTMMMFGIIVLAGGATLLLARRMYA
ncbi:DUF5979 domain-containing protein [Schaalia suimastitidis]|uniref:DUF5979 domain-containing protein n=1 Tax=Schaalia suimastitidis TaxID=121163 RepID=UPI000479D17F|nr:DUF5979 domain-containing protein [Schaalia suimastitidis]